METMDTADLSPALLGIEGLANQFRDLLPGGIYAVVVDNPQVRRLLAATTLRFSEQSGLAMACITADPAALNEELQRLRGDEIEVTPVRLFQLQGHLADNLRQYGVWRWLDELESMGVGRASALILEPAQGVIRLDQLTLANQQQRLYGDWLRYHRCAALWIFADEERLWPQLLTVREYLSGLACLQSSGYSHTWNVEFWTAREAFSGSTCLALQVDPYGSLFALQMVLGKELLNAHAADQERVVVTRAAVQGESGIPVSWEIIEDIREVAEQLQQAVAATVILDFSPEVVFDELAHLVHQLRLRSGRRLKLIVRGRGRPLRYAQELLLLRLGATVLVDMEVSLTRLLRIVVSIQAQVYGREIETDYEGIIALANPDLPSGYLSPLAFCVAVRESLQRSELMGLESIMVRLRLLQGTHHRDVLQSCLIKRSGDFYTLDDSSLYFFLYACPSTSLEATLPRILLRPVAELFDQQTQFSDALTLEEALKNLEHRANTQALLDYSEILLTAAAAEAEPLLVRPDVNLAQGQHSVELQSGGLKKIHLPLRRGRDRS